MDLVVIYMKVKEAYGCEQVEIVMGREEAFDITVQEDSAQTIATVQDAADLIEDLIMEKGA